MLPMNSATSAHLPVIALKPYGVIWLVSTASESTINGVSCFGGTDLMPKMSKSSTITGGNAHDP